MKPTIDDDALRNASQDLPPTDCFARVALVWELPDPIRPEAARRPKVALEIAELAATLSLNVKAGPLQAIAETLFANGDAEAAAVKMHGAPRVIEREGRSPTPIALDAECHRVTTRLGSCRSLGF